MTKEQVRFQVAVSVIQGIIEGKHGIIGEVVPAAAVDEAFRIADQFTKKWFEKYEGEENGVTESKALSEDEKIRKALIELVYSDVNDLIGGVEKRLCVSYLKKQKEQKPAEDVIGEAISFFCVESLLDNANGLTGWEKFVAWLYCEFLRGLPKKLNQEYIKEQSAVILDFARKELAKMPDSTLLIEMWDKEKAILQERALRGDVWRTAQNAFMDGFAIGCCVTSPKQNPAEWSEEDEKMVQFYEADYNNEIGNMPAKQVVEMRVKFKEWLTNRLKFIRHQPHWKPSKKQIDAIHEANFRCRAYQFATHLTEIEIQLEKLMNE